MNAAWSIRCGRRLSEALPALGTSTVAVEGKGGSGDPLERRARILYGVHCSTLAAR